MKSVSKSFYLSSIIIGLISPFLLPVMLSAVPERGDFEYMLNSFLVIGVGISLAAYGAAMLLILIYKMWASLSSEYARTTPGKAVGLLFIPIFNLYWVFQALWGWSKDYNKSVSENGASKKKISEILPLTICILLAITFFSILGIEYIRGDLAIVAGLGSMGILAFLVNIILIIIFANKAIDGINYLVREST